MLVILDNGHGGLIKDVPQTPERRSKIFTPKKQLFEGEFNRAIINGIIPELTLQRIPYLHISPEIRDVRLDTRIARANRNNEKNAFLVSAHCNYGGGHGSEFFCFTGSKKGQQMATIFAEEFQKAYPNRRLRTFGDGNKFKEGNFSLLRKTQMPAVITENFFFDNEEEVVNILLNREERQRIIDFHVNAIVRIIVEVFKIELLKS